MGIKQHRDIEIISKKCVSSLYYRTVLSFFGTLYMWVKDGYENVVIQIVLALYNIHEI